MTHEPQPSRARFVGRTLFVAAALVLAGACSGGSGSKSGSTTSPLVCDVTLPTACTDHSLGYDDVAPIFEARCLGCHSGQPGGPWPLDAYEHAADWANEIRGQISACTMPPPDAGIDVPTKERDTLLMWVRCGAPR
jgi:uncharacterized membrane protein